MIQIYNVHLYNLNSTTVIVPIYHFWYGHSCNWSFDVQGQAFIFNTLRPRQNGPHFADNTFKRIFLNDNVRISIKISLKFVPKGPIINIPALVQIKAWRRPGDKPLSEPMLVSLLLCLNELTHWGWDRMAANFLTTFSNAFSWMKTFEFRFKFHWILFLGVQLTIFQHWFWWWLGIGQAPSHYLNQWWLIYWCVYVSLCLNVLTLAAWVPGCSRKTR